MPFEQHDVGGANCGDDRMSIMGPGHAPGDERQTIAEVGDLGSKNGTFVGGRPVTSPQTLEPGDEIRVGPVALTFSLNNPDPTETMP